LLGQRQDGAHAQRPRPNDSAAPPWESAATLQASEACQAASSARTFKKIQKRKEKRRKKKKKKKKTRNSNKTSNYKVEGDNVKDNCKTLPRKRATYLLFFFS
jgi:hypothetical protein